MNEPVVLDDLSTGHRSFVQWGPLVKGDISDETLIRNVIDRYDITSVVHFAANAYVGESMVVPRKYFQNNVCNTLKLLNAVVDSGVTRFVFSSTCATYGLPQSLPIDEAHPQAPVNPYGESKLFIERVLHWYGQAHGLNAVCLRYFNAAGADPDGDIGELHTPETHLIPLAIQAAMEGHPALKIFGDDYDTPDGTAVRDYIHVCDLADAHVRALKYLAEGGTSSAFNLGTGCGYSVLDVQRAVAEVSGRKVPAQFHARRAGDPAILVANAGLARRVLGWEPRFTGLAEIVNTAWSWYASEQTPVACAV